MKPRLFVPPLDPALGQRLRQGLRSTDAFTARRCQVLLASARGDSPTQIARHLGCTPATVPNPRRPPHPTPRPPRRYPPPPPHHPPHPPPPGALPCCEKTPPPPPPPPPFLDDRHTEALKDLLHHSPRLFGQPTSLWTLDRVAEV